MKLLKQHIFRGIAVVVRKQLSEDTGIKCLDPPQKPTHKNLQVSQSVIIFYLFINVRVYIEK